MATPVLPESLKFQPSAPSVRAKQYRSACQPTSGATAAPLDTVRISIPCNPHTFLNGKQSYLTYDIKNTNSTAATKMSCVGWNPIRRVEVYSGGNLLSSTDEYSLMHSIYHQASINSADNNTVHSILSNQWDNVQGTNNYAGVQIGATINKDATVKVAFPLIDPVLGTGTSSMLPLGGMADLELVLTLHDAATAVYNRGTTGEDGTATTNYELTNIRFMAAVVELDAGASAALNSAVGGVYRVSSQGIRNYSFDIPASTSSVSALISARFQSWNSFIACMRNNSFINDNSRDSQNIRARNLLTSYNLRAGSEFIPAQEVKSGAGETAEVFMELEKSFHGVGSTLSHGCMTKAAFEKSNPECQALTAVLPSDAEVLGSFTFGLDLSSYGSNSDEMLDGINTLASQSFLELRFSSNSEAVAMRGDLWARFDQMTIVDSNTGITQVTF